MEIDFHKGFIVYKKGPGPVFVAPHSGPSLEVPTARDDNSETVASLCWLRMGGSLVVSTMPRKMMLGVDFNRDPPRERLALEYWKKFEGEEEWGKLMNYRKKYSWVAYSKKDHSERMKIYRDFWKTIRGFGDTIVFIHRMFNRIKNFPSMMDIITYGGYGVNKDIMRRIISEINRDYAGFFKKIAKNYKSAILMEEKRAVERILKIFKSFDINDIKIEYRENIKKDLEIIMEYASAKVFKRMYKKPGSRNFISAVSSALSADVNPLVTLEHIFKGEPAWGRKKGLFGKKNMMEAEISTFLGYWYPGEAAGIIIKIINNVRTIRKLPMYTELEW